MPVLTRSQRRNQNKVAIQKEQLRQDLSNAEGIERAFILADLFHQNHKNVEAIKVPCNNNPVTLEVKETHEVPLTQALLNAGFTEMQLTQEPKQKLRIQRIAETIIRLPKGLPSTYKNLSNAEALERALTAYENGSSNAAENKLATFYYRKEGVQQVKPRVRQVKHPAAAEVVEAIQVDDITSLAPCEVKEPVSEEPVEIEPGIYRKVFANGTIYEGEMQNNMLHGFGTYTYPITEPDEVRSPTYVGYFANNLEHGKGQYDWGLAYDYYYDGDFVNGHFHGNGKLVNGSVVQKGEFVCGVFKG